MQQMKTTLVISAHAADFCSRAGGTITKLVRLGESVHVIDLTMGERGESEEFWRGIDQHSAVLSVKHNV
jgi:4-oxalomesaconate hydratase